MTALRLNLAAIKDRPTDPHIGELAQKADELAEQLDADVDFLAWELRPAALDDVGLADTLRRFVQEWSAHYGITVDFHTSGLDERRLAPVIETNLYRIAQEAMNNVYKHARASRVDLILERRGVQVVLILEDDGVGFDPATVAETTDGKELGLSGMRERVTLIGGTLDVETNPGKGTTVFVKVPAED
jgi:signal transduction histidine kinase